MVLQSILWREILINNHPNKIDNKKSKPTDIEQLRKMSVG